MQENPKKPLIIIAGPTASGKTGLAIETALLNRGEVVSADSMQVYRGMDIGTAKPSLPERMGVPHHMIDVACPTEAFSVAAYQKKAKACIAEIHKRGNIPILTGGTGFYINALLYDCAFEFDLNKLGLNKNERELQALYMQKAAQGENIHQMLLLADPAAAAEIHPNNLKRVARALAYYEATGGRRISDHNQQMRQKPPAYDFHFIVLSPDRTRLYAAIKDRVEGMIRQGLADEAAYLLKTYDSSWKTALQAIGCKELLPYLRGACSLEEAAATIVQNTRRYAKRQITWFRQKAPAGSLWVYL